MKLKRKFIFIFSIALVIGIFIGFIIGETNAIGICASVGVKVAHLQGINITLDSKAIASGILQYEDKIKTRIP